MEVKIRDAAEPSPTQESCFTSETIQEILGTYLPHFYIMYLKN